MTEKKKQLIKRLILVFIILLLLSGITAFPLRTEIAFLEKHSNYFPQILSSWIHDVHEAIDHTPEVVLYGTDWLAFGHIVIALFFIPVYKDPEKYKLNLVAGMAACVGVFFIAFICGPIRNIPFFHQLIDCSFGVIGFILLYYVYTLINKK